MRNFVERNRLWLLINVFLVFVYIANVGRVAQPLSSVETLFTGKIVAFDDEVQAAKAKAEVKGAHGGEVFVAVKRRAYDGPRPFSGNGSTSDVSYKLIPRGAEELVCKKWAVLTTIFGPTELVKQLVGMEDWCVVVVGDKKVRGGKNIFSATTFVLGCNIL
jgi:hypothetical protein